MKRERRSSRATFFEKRRPPRKKELTRLSRAVVRRDLFFWEVLSFCFFFLYGGLECVLPFEMFDNIFVGCSAVFPNRPGPVEHKTKGGYDTDKRMEKEKHKICDRKLRKLEEKRRRKKKENARRFSTQRRGRNRREKDRPFSSVQRGGYA